ncbi:MAG: hypothetical protein EBT33_15975 [Betaproteobacteria bacterium]|nr:hypothetical protein [Betaproteobacteria bacterium]
MGRTLVRGLALRAGFGQDLARQCAADQPLAVRPPKRAGGRITMIPEETQMIEFRFDGWSVRSAAPDHQTPPSALAAA